MSDITVDGNDLSWTKRELLQVCFGVLHVCVGVGAHVCDILAAAEYSIKQPDTVYDIYVFRTAIQYREVTFK